MRRNRKDLEGNMDGELVGLTVISENHVSTDTNEGDTYSLLEAVLDNKIEEIQYILETSSIELINHKYDQYENKSILIIACVTENVSKETLRTLFTIVKSHSFNLNYVDEEWYKWEPLHYAAKIADPEKLQVLVDILDSVNSLTVFSENSLHVLLEYEESVKPFNAIIYNASQSRDCTILNTEKRNAIRCVQILIDAGVDVNHSNFWNETPICIAARYKYKEIIKILLKTPNIDLDNYSEDGMKVREYLKLHMLQDTLSPSSFLHEDPVKLLFNFLKAGHENAFLQFNNENIKDYVNYTDGDSELNTSGNMIQFCFKKGFFEYVQHDLYNEELGESNTMNTPMLKVFCIKGLVRCIDHLLNNGADTKLVYRKFPETILEAAAVRAILLQHKTSKIRAGDIFQILPKLFEKDHNLNNHSFYRKQVLSLLLNKLLFIKEREVLTSKEISILNSILSQLNLENDDERGDDSENICRILRLGGSLSGKINNTMVIQDLHPDILKNAFGRFFIEDESGSYSETKTLKYLIQDKRKQHLLRHPLLIHFIHNKWLKINYFFYLDLLLYTVFLVSTYLYMICTHSQCKDNFIKLFFYVFLTIYGMKEGCQLFLYRTKYFLDASNCLELIVITSCLVTIFYVNAYSIAISLLFSGQLPIAAKFTIIFGSTKYFLQYASFYFMQFVSFALVFYVIFPFDTEDKTDLKNETVSIFGNIFKSLFYTLILFTGEFNDRVLEPEKFPVFGRIVITVFIFCMTIILNNLLVGLIVADMDEMQREGQLQKQENKTLDISDCSHLNVFDDEDRKYLRDIRNKKTPTYDKNLLKNVYGL
ncbi:hypothetical protein NQ317_000422 [Molorchus minor]|uniref:Ion transport domain-containing protein n=1 Tax=Molorchus minor TaxID=1323400 RepID=A0ABQ9JXZ9_9CUCU|nr:hypothetical protein NQ317_000422 [Molorchus minor]